MYRRLRQNPVARIGLAGFAAFTVTCVLSATIIAVDGLTDSAAPSDVVVVLGNEVLADGTPSPRLAARLDAAVRVHTAGLADNVIVSGGVGHSGHSEAEVMAAYLVEAGVEGDRIVIDPDGVNTRATAVNSAEIMAEQGWSSAIVATQFYHIPRSQMAFEQAGVEPVTTVRATYFEPKDIFSLAREVAAYAQYWLLY